MIDGIEVPNIIYEDGASVVDLRSTPGYVTLYAMWTPVCDADSRILHFGDDSLCLSPSRDATKPALVVLLDNTKYYANMCKMADSDCTNKSINATSNTKLHLMWNNEIYNVHLLSCFK